MSYHPPSAAVKARAKEIVDDYYATALDLGMMDNDGNPIIGYQVDGQFDGDYVSIGEHQPKGLGKPYYIVTVRHGKETLMQPLSPTPTLRGRLKEELARLMSEAMGRGREEDLS